jgi:hypothetical protein
MVRVPPEEQNRSVNTHFLSQGDHEAISLFILLITNLSPEEAVKHQVLPLTKVLAWDDPSCAFE